MKELKMAAGSLGPETNIKYYNIKDIRRNTKKASLPASPQDSQMTPETRATPPLVSSAFASPSLSPSGDIAALVSLRDGTTSSVADATQEVVKATEMLTGNASPDIRYAKITTRRQTKNLDRRKLNFDFVVKNSTALNKLTFSTTPDAWEWLRDIKRDYEIGKLTEADWQWYSAVYDRFKEVKTANPRATIGKGNRRASNTDRGSKPVRRTACIYTGTHVEVCVGQWHNEFELEAITQGRATTYYDSHAEYRCVDSEYEDLTWE